MLFSIASYSHFLESLPDAMRLVDRSGKISLANSQVNVLFGFEPDELQGQSIQILVPELKREAHASHMAGFFASHNRRMMGRLMKLSARRRMVANALLTTN